jgi:hypothetical protein
MKDEALKVAQPVQEPVAWMDALGDIYKHELWPDWNPPHTPLYATPPAAQRQWVKLTDEEIKEVNAKVSQIPPIDYTTTTYARAIEAKLKEKNT